MGLGTHYGGRLRSGETTRRGAGRVAVVLVGGCDPGDVCLDHPAVPPCQAASVPAPRQAGRPRRRNEVGLTL